MNFISVEIGNSILQVPESLKGILSQINNDGFRRALLDNLTNTNTYDDDETQAIFKLIEACDNCLNKRPVN